MTKQLYDYQFTVTPQVKQQKQKQSIYVVIAKPTRFCNADCSYCSSPPMEDMEISKEPRWDLEKFKRYFDRVYPLLGNGCFWIWHGGEPMLMGTDFYEAAYKYAKEKMDKEGRYINFSMQTNMLAYNDKWYSIFSEQFGGSISTSFDPDETQRTIKGNTVTFSRVFKKALNKVLDDGFRPMVIGVYNEETAHLMNKMYDWSLSMKEKSFPLRFNYCHPTGRLESKGEAISPITYGKSLIEVYNRWIKDNPNFTITPLDQMFKKVIGMDGEGHCPWTKKCGGRFIEIEPNGEVYNCADFADLGKKYCFGNLNTEVTLEEMLMTKPALQIKRRVTQLPVSCQNCEHFDDCEGGCMRDSVLYKHGLYGKFHYCESWKMVFTRIKESIVNGEADEILKSYGLEPELVKNYVKQNIQNSFDFTKEEWDYFYQNGVSNKFGFADNYASLNETNYSLNGEYIKNKNAFAEIIYEDPETESINISKANQKLLDIKIKVDNKGN